MAEAGELAPLLADALGEIGADVVDRLARVHARAALLEELRAQLRRAEDDGAAAEDAGGDGALKRGRVGRERHPGGDVRGHHPVLGDRDEQEVEEVALLLGRLLAGEQQVEVLGEAQPAHEVAGEVAPADLHAVGVRLADVAQRRAGPPDLRHRRRRYRTAREVRLPTCAASLTLNLMVQYQPIDRTLAALADPTRRDVLERLGRGSATITELAEPYGISLTGMKKHVRVLEDAGLVATEKVGRTRRCTVGPRRLEDVSEWIGGYRQMLEERLDRFGALLERTKGDTK